MAVDRLTPMLVFARIVETGNLSSAARSLEKSLPAISRTLMQLEERLGARLLNRTTRRVSLTDAGHAYYEHCRRILAEIEGAERSLASERIEPQGQLTVTAPLLFGRLHVAPLLNLFLAKHPRVSASLLLTDRNINLVEEGVDIAVRIGILADSSHVARALTQVPRVVCAAPAYLKRHGTPKHPRDLSTHNCIRFTGITPARDWTFRNGAKEMRVAVSGNLACNTSEPAVAAAVAGMGVASVIGYQVQDMVKAKKLVRLLRAFEPETLPVSAVFQSSRHVAARVRGFLDLLAEKIPTRIEI